MKDNGSGNTAKRKSEIRSHGIRLLLSNHKKIRKLKKDHIPWNHGYKVWPTSWLLIDYLKKNRLIAGQRILDLACGWGLSGIFCAKTFSSKVTSVDGDKEVCPYVKLLAEINKTEVNFSHVDINKVGINMLKDIDVIIGSDICFHKELIDPLRRLIKRAKRASVSQVYISDPGRGPFDELADHFTDQEGAEVIDWKTTKPVNVQGRIFKYELRSKAISGCLQF